MIDVYVHTSPSGKRYVGFSSRGMVARWRKHVWSASRGSSLTFHRAIRKYGADAFTYELLERMSTEAGAKRAEQLWIAELGTFGARGYNATQGGDGTLGIEVSPEHRARLSAANLGHKQSPEAVAKTSAANRGRKHTAEALAHMSAAQVGRTFSSEHRARLAAAHRGKTHTAEHRAKVSAAQRGRKVSPEALANMSAAQRRPETRAKKTAALRGRKQSIERISKRTASRRASAKLGVRRKQSE